MATTFQQRIKDVILQQLESGPKSIVDITPLTEASYHSVRNAMRELEDEGLVSQATKTYRNAKFMLNASEGPNRIMPTLKLGDERHKMIVLLGQRHNTSKPAAFDAVLNLPRHITRLLKVSMLLKESDDSQERTLRLIRSQMETDLEKLQRVTSLYEQLLDNPKNWNPEFLRRYCNDVYFNIDEVNSAYAFYFKE